LDGLHPYYQTFKLKNRLIKEGIKENACDICSIREWNGNSINMQLDHIDGDPHNHKLNNLRMICPNCHSQTLTYCGKINK
jgi:Zn finger protein HypA/HybF involved in hydrogenase expression